MPSKKTPKQPHLTVVRDHEDDAAIEAKLARVTIFASHFCNEVDIEPWDMAEVLCDTYGKKLDEAFEDARVKPMPFLGNLFLHVRETNEMAAEVITKMLVSLAIREVAPDGSGDRYDTIFLDMLNGRGPYGTPESA